MNCITSFSAGISWATRVSRSAVQAWWSPKARCTGLTRRAWLARSTGVTVKTRSSIVTSASRETRWARRTRRTRGSNDGLCLSWLLPVAY